MDLHTICRQTITEAEKVYPVFIIFNAKTYKSDIIRDTCIQLIHEDFCASLLRINHNNFCLTIVPMGYLEVLPEHVWNGKHKVVRIDEDVDADDESTGKAVEEAPDIVLAKKINRTGDVYVLIPDLKTDLARSARRKRKARMRRVAGISRKAKRVANPLPTDSSSDQMEDPWNFTETESETKSSADRRASIQIDTDSSSDDEPVPLLVHDDLFYPPGSARCLGSCCRKSAGSIESSDDVESEYLAKCHFRDKKEPWKICNRDEEFIKGRHCKYCYRHYLRMYQRIRDQEADSEPDEAETDSDFSEPDTESDDEAESDDEVSTPDEFSDDEASDLEL